MCLMATKSYSIIIPIYYINLFLFSQRLVLMCLSNGGVSTIKFISDRRQGNYGQLGMVHINAAPLIFQSRIIYKYLCYSTPRNTPPLYYNIKYNVFLSSMRGLYVKSHDLCLSTD